MILRHPRLRPALAAVAAALTLVPAGASAAEYAPGEVVVKREGQAPQVRKVDDVGQAVAALRRSGAVDYAAPNPIARTAGFIPNDPGDKNSYEIYSWNQSVQISCRKLMDHYGISVERTTRCYDLEVVDGVLVANIGGVLR